MSKINLVPVNYCYFKVLILGLWVKMQAAIGLHRLFYKG